MGLIKRSYEIIGHIYFCSYEYLSSILPKFLVKLVGFLFFFPFRKLLAFPPPVRLRVTFERLGPAYQKIGQLLSTRVDILPPEFIKELEKLQDKVPLLPPEKIFKNCGYLKEHIKDFDPIPLGSGSVAQVHRAVLKDGREVAIKILRPDARETIKGDMRIRQFKIPEIVEEFERMLTEELDLRTEAAYMELFRSFSKEEPNLYVPEVLWELSGREVLVMELVKGKKLTEVKDLPESRRKELAENLVRIIHRTIFELGVFHEDLHPGNIFLLEDGRFAFIDFGIVGRLSPDTLSAFFVFSIGVMNKDLELIIGALKEIGAIPEGTKETLLKREILSFLDKYYNRPLSQIDAEKLFYEELSAARRFRIVLPEELLVLMKTIAHTESMARLIYPDFRLPPLLKPYLKKIAPRITIQEVKRRFLRLALEYTKLLENIPKILEDKQKERVKRSETFLGCALLGFAVVLAFAPKLLLVYLPSVLAVKKLQK
jgi:ubiquinone biosynthesis protein